ncbi:MAG: efflux RND transporter permease subunit, partial [Myxococcales bacterium]|nr:efflux RND transporter permease subunit [Myxococcales bacterium]
RLTSANRGLADVSALERLAVGPGSVPLREIASLEVTNGIDYIRRRDQRRTVTVFADNESWITPDEIITGLRAQMARIGVPPGVDITYAGENEERDRSMRSLAQAMQWGLVTILFILAAQFNSLKQPLIVMLAIPLSFIGVIAGLWITGNHFGFLSFVGTVALTGIVVNDAIVLVDYANQARRSRGFAVNDALIEACHKRLRPVLMTSITTIGGLLPLALDWSGGGDFWAPLAWSIIFGLAVATVLTLVVIPTLYSLVERGGALGASPADRNPGPARANEAPLEA